MQWSWYFPIRYSVCPSLGNSPQPEPFGFTSERKRPNFSKMPISKTAGSVPGRHDGTQVGLRSPSLTRSVVGRSAERGLRGKEPLRAARRGPVPAIGVGVGAKVKVSLCELPEIYECLGPQSPLEERMYFEFEFRYLLWI